MKGGVVPLLLLLLLGACARPTFLDGAWEGTADCTDTGNHTISGLFDEEVDGDVDGFFYIEDIDFFGAQLTIRADLDGAEYDADDDEYQFDLNSDGDDDPEFKGALEIDAEDPDDASGELEQFDEQGEVTQTCEIDLSRLSVSDN